MAIHEIKIRLKLTEEMLGTASANPKLYEEFIASNRPEGVDQGELATLPKVEEELAKSTTVFHRGDDGDPILYDYAIKGFFKDACGCLSRVGKEKAEKPEVDEEGKKKPTKKASGGTTESSKITAYKKVIDGLIFVFPRKIKILMPAETKVGICERPLRAQTAQGERVAIARSETVPAGSILEFTIQLLDGQYDGVVEEWLQYGALRGLGQWRNSGKGRFEFERVKAKA